MAIDPSKTRRSRKANGTEVTELSDSEGKEVTNVWVEDGHVYWDDPGAGTVHIGTAWEFARWCMLRM
jgi:hypothetical protein